MINRASRSSALILAGGLLVLLAIPAMAAASDDSTANTTSDSQAAPAARTRAARHVVHHRRHYAHRRVQAGAKVADEKTDDEKATAPAAAATDNRVLQEIPPSIANANAQMLLAGAQISAAAAIPQGADNGGKPLEIAGADKVTVVAASDQLNDTDRTLQESNSTAAAAMSPVPAPVPTITVDSTVWDQTSLIGKIFIGFGALLTMASAARMFIT